MFNPTAETGVATPGGPALDVLTKSESLGGDGTPAVAAFTPETFALKLGISGRLREPYGRVVGAPPAHSRWSTQGPRRGGTGHDRGPRRDACGASQDCRRSELHVFFEHQADPQAVEMAAFPARDKHQFAEHWARSGRRTLVARTIVADDMVAGNIGSWQESGQQLLGYWVGREWWGRGIATQALTLFVDEVSIRPLYAHVAVHNVGSIRVLDKCGFRRDHVQEAKAPVPDDGIKEFIFVLNA